MGIADKMWHGITTVIKMNDQVERLAATIIAQQQKSESPTDRVIRLETALEIGRACGSSTAPRRIERKG